VSDALLLGLPVLAVVGLVALIYSRSGKRADTYRLGQPWTHEPILWSATGERLPATHGHAHGELTIGGGASGRW
jgi:hypothetical protein